MILIIAENPVLGRAIAAAIAGSQIESNGCIYKGRYAIIWAYGHLMTLKAPEDYNKELKKWSLEQLPIFFENWESKPKPSDRNRPSTSAKARLEQIKELSTRLSDFSK